MTAVAVAPAVKEWPMLFSGDMVRALLDGRKTQTRRVVTDLNSVGNFKASELLLDDPRTFSDDGPSPAGNAGPYLHGFVNAPLIETRRKWKRGDCDPAIMERLYPRYQVGDRLWLRENWNARMSWPIEDGVCVERWWPDMPHAFRGAKALEEGAGYLAYAADQSTHYRIRDHEGFYIQQSPTRETLPDRWCPSIHMPRWASRLTLEITEVRVERLQGISEADVKAEGCDYLAYRCAREMEPCDEKEYSDLWDMINAKRGYSWESNPWVWVISFRQVEG